MWHTELDGQDFMTVRCLSPHATEDRSQWLAQQRIFWRQILDDLGSQGSVQPNAHSTASAEQSSTVQPQQAPLAAAAQSPAYSPQFTQRMFTTLDQAVQLFDILTQQGQLLGKTPKAGQLFLRNCERLQAVLDACPELRSLGAFWRELRQERGERLDDLLELTTHLGTQLVDWRDKYANGTPFA